MTLKEAIIEVFYVPLQGIVATCHLCKNILLTSCQITTNTNHREVAP